MARLLALLFSMSLFVTNAWTKGMDSYEVYLNGKLLKREIVTKSFDLNSIRLDKSNINDNLVIYYHQCHGVPGTNRSITVRDGNGKTIKEWKFADEGKDNAGMSIPVKDILQLQKGASRQYVFVYTTGDRPQGQVLASL